MSGKNAVLEAAMLRYQRNYSAARSVLGEVDPNSRGNSHLEKEDLEWLDRAAAFSTQQQQQQAREDRLSGQRTRSNDVRSPGSSSSMSPTSARTPNRRRVSIRVEGRAPVAPGATSSSDTEAPLEMKAYSPGGSQSESTHDPDFKVCPPTALPPDVDPESPSMTDDGSPMTREVTQVPEEPPRNEAQKQQQQQQQPPQPPHQRRESASQRPQVPLPPGFSPPAHAQDFVDDDELSVSTGSSMSSSLFASEEVLHPQHTHVPQRIVAPPAPRSPNTQPENPPSPSSPNRKSRLRRKSSIDSSDINAAENVPVLADAHVSSPPQRPSNSQVAANESQQPPPQHQPQQPHFQPQQPQQQRSPLVAVHYQQPQAFRQQKPGVPLSTTGSQTDVMDVVSREEYNRVVELLKRNGIAAAAHQPDRPPRGPVDATGDQLPSLSHDGTPVVRPSHWDALWADLYNREVKSRKMYEAMHREKLGQMMREWNALVKQWRDARLTAMAAAEQQRQLERAKFKQNMKWLRNSRSQKPPGSAADTSASAHSLPSI